MSTAKWQLREAKSRLSEVVRKAWSEGPQIITLHGADAAVVISTRDFCGLSRRKGSLVEFSRRSPWVGVQLDLTRSRDAGRKIDL